MKRIVHHVAFLWRKTCRALVPFCGPFLLILWMGLLGVQGATAQTATGREAVSDRFAGDQNLKFARLSIEQGLSHNDIRAITQDCQGFMWFGTMHGGLCRFDGYEFKVYTYERDNPHSLSHNSVWALLDDPQGNLWVGTIGGGLDRYDRSTDRFDHFRHDPQTPSTLASNFVTALFQDRQGTLWVGSKAGLSRLDRPSGTFRNYPEVGWRSSVRCMWEEPESGVLWVGTGKGLFLFDPSREQTIETYVYSAASPQNCLSNNGVNCIYQDSGGTVWLGTDDGLNRFVPQTKTFVQYRNRPGHPDSIVNNRIGAVLEDRQGRFWVATRFGLDLMDRPAGTFTHFQHDSRDPYSLGDDMVAMLYEDRAATLWVGTVNAGISRMMTENKAFSTLQYEPHNPNSLGHNTVTAICPDRVGRVWIGTHHGLNCYENGTVKHFVHDPADASSLSHNYVKTIAEDAAGTLWIGTTGGGLNRFDGNRFSKVIYAPHRPDAKRVTSLVAAPDGGIWAGIGTLGIFHLSRQGSEKIESSTIWPYLGDFDRDGNLWLGSENAGILRVNSQTGQSEMFLVAPHNPSGEENQQFYAVAVDADGYIWAGGGSGLYCFDPVTETFIRHYTRKDGLPVDSVVSIMADDAGQLWVGTIAGLSRLDPPQARFRNYDLRDGLPGNQFNQRAAAKGPDGRMYFGTTRGLVTFRPDQLKDNPNIPPVALTGFELFDKPVRIGGEQSPLTESILTAEQIRLRYDQSIFTFLFSALCYTAPQKCRYAYKMEGFDEDWRYTDASRRQATYTRLAPGTYTFRVRASNNDGIWNDAGTSVAVVILPPWWGTWWFRAAALLCIGIALLALHEFKTRQIKSMNLQLARQVHQRTAELEAANQELEAFAYSVSHDLRTPLRGIDGFSDLLLKRYKDTLDEKGQDYLLRVRNATQRMGHLIDDLLNLSRLSRAHLNVRPVDLSALVRAIVEERRQAEPQRRVQWVIADAAVVQADASLLRIVLDNLIDNAIKFTQNADTPRIEFGMTDQDGQPVYYINDNGAGFDMKYADKLFGAFQRLHTTQEYPGTGIGLVICKRIIRRHGGRIWAQAEVNRGATFYFTLEE